ncbi:hypothetical protein MKK55_12425 [Methylobacterium sp. J-059]|uniref:hypothetical protein n=1 Tax=Methylobacterium sp. J-059 TaxID=2836643 RepID=UPI001FB880ED|nr:hypothetical protein [Methylobacterium sp. J-059]MCJ2039742.1 hypothetical protein [Methylobacterium sp. J-059]
MAGRKRDRSSGGLRASGAAAGSLLLNGGGIRRSEGQGDASRLEKDPPCSQRETLSIARSSPARRAIGLATTASVLSGTGGADAGIAIGAGRPGPCPSTNAARPGMKGG